MRRQSFQSSSPLASLALSVAAQTRKDTCTALNSNRTLATPVTTPTPPRNTPTSGVMAELPVDSGVQDPPPVTSARKSCEGDQTGAQALEEPTPVGGGGGESGDKEGLITEILELQNTLHDLSQRVHSVKEENEQLQVDNQVRASFHSSHPRPPSSSPSRFWTSTYRA